MKKQLKLSILFVLALVFLAACGKNPSVKSISVSSDKKSVTVTLSAPVKNKPKARYWVNVIPAGEPDSAWGAWKYVPDNATSVTITLKANYGAGKYQSRLHSDYPTKTYNVVSRKEFTIE